MIPLNIISIMFSCSSIFYCVGRYITAREILKIKYSGSISSATAFGSFGGIFGRLITIYVDIGTEDLFLLGL